jgi:hypothetical protein
MRCKRTLGLLGGACVALGVLATAWGAAFQRAGRETAAQGAFRAWIGEVAAAAGDPDFLAVNGFQDERVELYVTDQWHDMLLAEQDRLLDATAAAWEDARRSAGLTALRGTVALWDTGGNRVALRGPAMRAH